MERFARASSRPGTAHLRVARRPVHLAAELARFCATRLPSFAIPRFIDIVADLPRTENDKVQKYKLRERGVTASAWDRQAPARSDEG